MINDWSHLNERLQKVVESDTEVVLPCAMCGDDSIDSSFTGSLFESQCCRFGFIHIQKSDYLNKKQKDSYSVMNYRYNQGVEDSLHNIITHERNKMIKQMKKLMTDTKFYEHPAYIGLANNEDFADDERQPEWKEQFEDNGFDATLCWNFDYSMVEWILPKLIYFLERSRSTFASRDDMHNQLDFVVQTFQDVLSNENYNCEGLQNDLEDAIIILGENFHRLWL